jgi:type I restriction enzyme S subunit
MVGVYSFGRGLFRREPQSGAHTSYKFFYRLKPEHVVMSQLFGWEGALALSSDEYAGMYVSPQFPTFLCDSDKLDRNFLGWFIRRPAFWQDLGTRTKGMGDRRRTLNPEALLSSVIPLPSLTEQYRVVARIEELSTKVEEARSLRNRAVEEAKALLIAVMRRIFAPGTYPEVALESVCTAIIDNLHSNPVYVGQGVPCVRSSDVGWGKLNLATARRTSEEEYLRRTVRGEPITDDIVLVREGGGTGKSAIVEEGQRFSLAQRVMMLRSDQKLVLPKFMLYQILSPAIYDEQIHELTKGSASPHLNIGALRKFRFYLPSIEEQLRIVAYLDSVQAKVDSLKKLQEETTEELDALMPSILSSAFSGAL